MCQCAVPGAPPADSLKRASSLTSNFERASSMGGNWALPRRDGRAVSRLPTLCPRAVVREVLVLPRLCPRRLEVERFVVGRLEAAVTLPGFALAASSRRWLSSFKPDVMRFIFS